MSEINRDTLMAYLDGQLDAGTTEKVDAHLLANPDAAAEIAALRRQADAIRTLYPSAAAEPVPTRLAPHRLALIEGRRRWQTMARAAMVTALLGIGFGAGWLARPGDGPAVYNRLIADAVSAHTVYVAENRHAVEVASSEAEHLSTWLSDRLATSLPMPDLTAEGFDFLGGRLLPAPAIPGGRAAQLMFANAEGERLTLYITPSTGIDGPAYETVSLGGDTALYWADAVFTCTIVGNGTPAALHAVGNAVMRQLAPAYSRAL